MIIIWIESGTGARLSFITIINTFIDRRNGGIGDGISAPKCFILEGNNFFVVGWYLGSLISKAIQQVFSSLKIDAFFASMGGDDFFKKAGITLNSGYFVGEVVRWFVIIVFLLPSLSLVGLTDVSTFLSAGVLGFLPEVIIAAFVLIIAAIVSEGLAKAVLATAKSVNLKSAHMLSTVSKYAVWIFAIIIALGKLGLGDYMSILFTGIVAMLALGGALAFGLGGKEAAGRFISKLGEEEMPHR